MKENPFNGTVSRICFIKKNSVFICVLYLKSKCFETRLRCELQNGQFYRIDVRHFNDVNMAKELSNWDSFFLPVPDELKYSTCQRNRAVLKFLGQI